MYSDAEFDVDSDFAIKRGLNPRVYWFMDSQSQKDHQNTTNEEKG